MIMKLLFVAIAMCILFYIILYKKDITEKQVRVRYKKILHIYQIGAIVVVGIWMGVLKSSERLLPLVITIVIYSILYIILAIKYEK